MDWHDNQTRGFENEEEVAEVIKKNARSGQKRYILPHLGEVPSFLHPTEKEARDEKVKKARDDGPFVYAIVRPGKKPFSMAAAMAWSYGRAFVGAMIIGWLLNHMSMGYGKRVTVAAAMGIFAAVTAVLPDWIWFEMSSGELAITLADRVVEWLLAGLVLALFAGQPEVAER
ncbi:MAG: hypothetical protein KDK99_10290 [Verrucomicrobiales bacterium]|nr:hypothetical protein [Verrucomicrobiales bacterium]